MITKVLIIAVVLALVGVLAALLYMRYLAKNSPSIMGGGYDKQMQSESEFGQK
jgi:hypothetical protein